MEFARYDIRSCIKTTQMPTHICIILAQQIRSETRYPNSICLLDTPVSGFSRSLIERDRYMVGLQWCAPKDQVLVESRERVRGREHGKSRKKGRGRVKGRARGRGKGRESERDRER